jgi:hypothetical protein
MSKKAIILHTLAKNAPLNSMEIYDKTTSRTGQTKKQAIDTICELKRDGLITRNRYSRYLLSDEGLNLIKIQTRHEPLPSPAVKAQKYSILNRLQQDKTMTNTNQKQDSKNQNSPDENWKLQQIIDLAQTQTDSIATNAEPPIPVANAFIQMREIAQELITQQ